MTLKSHSWAYVQLKLQFKKINAEASVVVQWSQVCLAKQGTLLQFLVQEDPKCYGATKPMRHNYQALSLGPTRHNS